MTESSNSLDPQELTSFSYTSSPSENKSNLIQFVLDLLKRSENDVQPAPEPSGSKEQAKSVSRKVTTFESVKNSISFPQPSINSSSSDDMKKYWMPDDQCKECYECGAVFSTFRRRHHCRLCGQIFCYECCSDMISGKITGYGDAEVQLRVCKYCLELKSKSMQLDRRPSVSQALMFSPSLERPESQSSCHDQYNPNIQEELQEDDIWRINLHIMWSLFRSPSSSIQPQPLWNKFRYYSQAYYLKDILTWLQENLQKPEETKKMLDAWIESERLLVIDNNKTMLRAGPKDDFNENTVSMFEQIKKESQDISTNSIERMIQEVKENSQIFDVNHAANISSFVHVDTAKDLDDEYWHSSDAHLNNSHYLDDSSGYEIIKTVESMNRTSHAIQTPESRNSEISAIEYGKNVFEMCIQQESPTSTTRSVFTGNGNHGDTAGLPYSEVFSENIKSLYNIYDKHMESILDMLILKEGIPSEWSGILRKLVTQAAADVTPSPMNGDSMDVRRYVKFKKISGEPMDSEILDGYVFSKTISHKKMRSDIDNPRIMLLSGSISYQRVLNKLTSLNPVFLQEREFLSNSVDRIASFKPDVLVVEKSVSQIAKNELLDKGITLVLNLKHAQIDKLARIVQGDIFQNLDNINFIPASDALRNQAGQSLGHCERFHSKFVDGFHGSKSLLFFTGCEKHLGKTILLRGSNKAIMKKVKKVAQYYLYALYNKRLETHYLRKSKLRIGEYSINTLRKMEVDFGYEPITPPSLTSPIGDDVFDNVRSPVDDADCESQSSLGSSHHSTVSSRNQKFSKLIETSIFSVTPFCRLEAPFLTTEGGNLCPTRTYFDKEIYYSPLLSSTQQENGHDIRIRISSENCEVEESILSPVPHPVIAFSGDDLAYYRAYGFWEFEKERFHGSSQVVDDEHVTEAPNRIRNRLEQNMRGKELDCLDFYNHQKLIVLFSSFSKQSLNHPNPCIIPWSLSMQFYGKNDLTLGIFLRDYCFQSSYECPNQQCKTEILSHDRRFVHAGQCVNLKEIKLGVNATEIGVTPLMWSVCSECLFMSDIAVVSKETWNFSFAKFLELKFYEKSLYSVGCEHSYHRYHTNFFALGNIVAAFSRSDVNVTEIVPLVSLYDFEDNKTTIAVGNGLLLNETVNKINSAVKTIGEKINGFTNNGTVDELSLEDARNKLNAEENSFKQYLAAISLEVEDSPKDKAIAIRRSIYRIQSELVFSIDRWNKFLLGLMKGRPDGGTKKKHRKTLPSAVSTDLMNSLAEPDESSTASSPNPHREFLPTTAGSSLNSTKPLRRSRSDTCLLDMNKSDSKLHKSFRSQEHGICENLQVPVPCEKHLSSEEESDDVGTTKNSDPKFYNRFANKTKRFFAAITESYKRIEVPFPMETHHRLTGGSQPTVLVNERHFTSIIAYALSSEQYRARVQLIRSGENEQDSKAFNAPPPTTSNYELDDSKIQQSGHWMNVHNSSDHFDPNKQGGSHRRSKSAEVPPNEIHKNNHVDVEFQDGPTRFSCKVYFAAEFEKLRSMLIPGESIKDFIFSLATCNKWRAKGGKSGVSFSKTQDDRWVVKEMSRPELQALLMFMPNYVEYIRHRLNDNRPTLLAKIVAACTVGFYNSHTSMSLKQDVIIMENIFYNASPSLVFDLKGSFRNRLVEETDEVLLDENFLRYIIDNPMYLRPHSKTFLRDAINCDTAFLAAQSIIDYSLLVGVTEGRLYVGIIDYIRKFTIDKKVEMIVKSGYSSTMPTIVSPEVYKERFCSQLERYFPLMPDKWTGMGADLYYSN